MIGVHPDLRQVAHRALQLSPVDFGIPKLGGVRSVNDQHKLYLEGKSKCDGVKKLSNHQPKEDGYGYALDFYAFVDGAASWDELHLTLIASAFLQAANEMGIKLEWGGLWKNFKDYPHVQMVID